MKVAILILLVLCGAQGAFWYQTRERLPNMDIVPEVPGEEAVTALSLGDSQVFFRLLGLQIQNAGDTYGRFSPLKDYDYNKLYHWFVLLDALDPVSDYVPTMAAYYYSQTQHTPDVQYIVDYLGQHARGREDTKWWWVIQAVYLAKHKLADQEQALELSRMLVNVKEVPLWARQMAAYIYAEQGEMDSALSVIEDIADNTGELSDKELNFMRYFVEERLNRLEKLDAIEEKLRQQQTK